MPTWAALQSLIQLGVAINAAIFSVASLREPLVAREREAMETLARRFDAFPNSSSARTLPEWAQFRTTYLETKASFATAMRSIARGDTTIQASAGVAAGLSFSALVWSAYCPDGAVGIVEVTILVLIAVGPSIGAILFNGVFVRLKLNAMKQHRDRADGQLVDLMGKITDEHLSTDS